MKRKTLLKNIACDLCGGKNFNLLIKTRDFVKMDGKTFNLVQCQKCHLVFLMPRPKRVADNYPENYEPHHPKKNDFFMTLMERLMKSYYKESPTLLDLLRSKFYEKIYNPIPNKYLGKVLDIGCGSGRNLKNLESFGWDIYGVDIALKAVWFAKNKLNLKNVRVGTVESQAFPSDYFDVVILSHTIEHLTSPRQTLIEIKRILKKGGLLLITTPDFSCFNAKIFRSYWFPLETPRHLYLFSLKTLKKMLAAVRGFKINQVKYDPSSYCLIKSLGYFLGNKKIINSVLPFLKIFLLPLTCFFSLINKSDVMTFYIEKVE